MSDYFESGYCVRTRSWHGKEDLHEDYPETWDIAREWAGLNWDPIADPIYARHLDDPEMLDGITALIKRGGTPEELLQLFKGSLQEMPDHQRIYRSDDFGKTLGCTSRKYEPITHGDFGRIMEAVLEVPKVKYDTAGSVEGGKCTWALAYLDEPVALKGRHGKDATLTLPYMALTARHDGMGGVRLQPTSVRVVCANTFRMAELEADAHGSVFTFVHSAGWEERIAEARDAVNGARDDFKAYCAWAQDMLGIKITAKQAETFVQDFIPMMPGITDRAAKNVEEARQAVRGILAGETSKGVEGTGYWLVQGAGEWLDHFRATRTDDGVFRRQLLEPNKAKLVAANLVREIAGLPVSVKGAKAAAAMAS
jgi:phage/plasmid-like protein (TIGR03299 family)